MITLGCEGRLQPIGYSSEGSSVLSIPPTGVTNWYPRGSRETSSTALKEDVLLDTSTGQKQQVIIGVLRSGYTTPNPTTLTLPLRAEIQTARDYRQYTYRREGGFQNINGVEDGTGKKVLRYSLTGPTPDTVEVYVDGVKRTRGTGPDEYGLFDGSPGSNVPPNTVSFNSTILGSISQIDIIVTQSAVSNQVTLNFTRAADDDSRVGTGAWEGIDTVSSPRLVGGVLDLFYLDFSEQSAIPNDVKFTLSSSPILAGTNIVQPQNAFILLTRSGLTTPIDTIESRAIELSNLVEGRGYMKSTIIDNSRRLLVSESALVDIYPPLTKNRFNRPTLVKTSLRGSTAAIGIDSPLIVGPDK